MELHSFADEGALARDFTLDVDRAGTLTLCLMTGVLTGVGLIAGALKFTDVVWTVSVVGAASVLPLRAGSMLTSSSFIVLGAIVLVVLGACVLVVLGARVLDGLGTCVLVVLGARVVFNLLVG